MVAHVKLKRKLRAVEMLWQVLRRCDAAHASVIFVMANKFASDYNQEDARNVMRAMAVQR